MANEADLLRNFIDSAEAVIYLKDEDGRFLMANSRAAAVTGKSLEEFLGKTDYDFYSKEDSDMFRSQDRRVAEAGRPMTFKTTINLDGKDVTFIDHKFPISVEGHPGAVGGVAVNITETAE